jgi:Recombinase
VRDKIAASKRKGIWVGGPVPLGYATVAKKIVVVSAEAEAVRSIFVRYLELSSVRALTEDLDCREVRSKLRRLSDGRTIGGARFGVAALAHLLKNRFYIGEVVYHGDVYRGEHEAILERALFEAVQGKLAAQAVARRCRLRGSPALGIVKLLEAVAGDRSAVAKVPGAVTVDGEGPRPAFVHDLDELRPARDLVRHRRKYFIGILDPCASIEFSRGCPWDCSFCSAWTFYGRSYRAISPERVVEDLASIREPGVFIVDDVAFVQEKHGFAIGEAIARKGMRKNFYLETRGDVLLRNKEVFQFWKKLGVTYIFLFSSRRPAWGHPADRTQS